MKFHRPFSHSRTITCPASTPMIDMITATNPVQNTFDPNLIEPDLDRTSAILRPPHP
jgi:hypothetical protein